MVLLKEKEVSRCPFSGGSYLFSWDFATNYQCSLKH